MSLLEAVDLESMLEGEVPDEEACMIKGCGRVAVWRLIMENECPHALHCDPCSADVRPWCGSSVEWECRTCRKFLGRFLRLERIKR